MGVIHVTVDMIVMCTKNIDNGKEVNDENEGPQYRALGYTISNGGYLGTECLNLNKLSAARSDANGDKPIEKDEVRDGVLKSTRMIMENKPESGAMRN